MDLRRLRKNDAEYMLEWMHDIDVVRHLGTDFGKRPSGIAKSLLKEPIIV